MLIKKLTLNYLNMKKLILFLLPVCLLLVLSSCSKKSTPSPSVTGTFTVTINGTPETFNVGAVAQAVSSDGSYNLTLLGTQSASVTNSMYIAITSFSPIIAGTYTGAGSDAAMSYHLASGAVYQYADDDAAAFSTVTIKSISSTNVQGTFSGNLNLISGSGPATQTLTNGTFNLRVETAD